MYSITGEYNFKIGDYIHIEENLKDLKWYTDEVYQIVNIIDEVLIVDRNFPHAKENTYYNRIHASKAVLDIKKTRLEKIKEFFNEGRV